MNDDVARRRSVTQVSLDQARIADLEQRLERVRTALDPPPSNPTLIMDRDQVRREQTRMVRAAASLNWLRHVVREACYGPIELSQESHDDLIKALAELADRRDRDLRVPEIGPSIPEGPRVPAKEVPL